MNLHGKIESAELRYKQILEEFFISVYDEKSLPSHGINHHRRVWNYSKQLITSLEEHQYNINPLLPEDLIIASYMHDIGMSVDPGIKHGHHSKDICKQFLRKNNLGESRFESLLSAIENHDNKEYKNAAGELGLLTILSVADDLDAFGFTGIYRYSETYLTRGINPREIGSHIIKNASQRFDNFIKTFGSINTIFLKQKERYDILYEFFRNYNILAETYNFGSLHPSGCCGVIEILLKMISDKKTIKEIFLVVENTSDDKVIKWFFSCLKSELLLEH
jgi:HD superfamily phosphodiesterase